MNVRYVRSDDLVWRRTEDAVIMLSVHRGGIMELSGTGMALWHLLDRPISLNEAADALGREFSAPPEAVTADLVPLLGELMERGIVRRICES